MNPLLRAAISALSSRVRRQAKKLGVSYEFLWMRADGDQLREIAALIDGGVLRPVVGRVVSFDQTAEALRSLGDAGTHGKTVVSMDGPPGAAASPAPIDAKERK